MKTISIVIAVAFVIISACMIMLTKKGVSLRTARLISPSEIHEFPESVAKAVVHPLFPEFKSSDIILVATDNSPHLQALLDQIRWSAEAKLGFTYNISKDPMSVASCPRPCWVQVQPQQAQQLVANEYVDQVVRPLNRAFFTLNTIEFDGYDSSKLEHCEAEKRLDLECLVTLSVKAAQKKMKDPSKRYFFMQKYNHSDYFLFVQKGA